MGQLEKRAAYCIAFVSARGCTVHNKDMLRFGRPSRCLKLGRLEALSQQLRDLVEELSRVEVLGAWHAIICPRRTSTALLGLACAFNPSYAVAQTVLSAVDGDGEVLGHVARLDSLDAGSLELRRVVVQHRVVVQLGAVQQAARPRKDRGHRVGGRLLALLVLAIVPRHGAMGGLCFDLCDTHVNVW